MQKLIEYISEYELKSAKFEVEERSRLSFDSVFDMLLITTNFSL